MCRAAGGCAPNADSKSRCWFSSGSPCLPLTPCITSHRTRSVLDLGGYTRGSVARGGSRSFCIGATELDLGERQEGAQTLLLFGQRRLVCSILRCTAGDVAEVGDQPVV